MTRTLVLHGHFYQPPRENPWTGIMEPEPSASPFHDWNERVYQECYRANDTARIVGGDGIIRSISSNYRRLSFNFGPTLLAWIEKNHPSGYRRLLQADRASIAMNAGHGNAIAQAYNHSILPLCNARDRVTQIRWGLAEFKWRFGRDAESLWLPETACNDAVMGSLIDEGLRYVILAPNQCKRVRKLDASEWEPASSRPGGVDTGVAYRYFHRDGSGRSIAIFFYDGRISREIAFGHALVTSQELMGVIGEAQGGPERIVSIATDGESYGHHTKWGDRTLAYALKHEALDRGYQVTNFGAYLDQAPPVWEAEIESGAEGEGTSWSCAHGVGRWIRDCGCHTGGQDGWNQAWRGPLRGALDILRDFAIACFEEGARDLLRDPWAARDAFIAVVLEPGPAARQLFLDAHASRKLGAADAVRALSLLDMQLQAMLMYTSCGWFFSDISGIETLQILKYAARLMDDLSVLGFDPPRERFLDKLAQARSNVGSLGSGADLFRAQVEPCRAGIDRIAADMAIGSLVEDPSVEPVGLYLRRVEDLQREALGKTTLATGRVVLESRITGRIHQSIFATLHQGAIDFHCCVAPFAGDRHLATATSRVMGAFHSGLVSPLLKTMREEFGEHEFGLENVLAGRRSRVARAVFGGIIDSLSHEYDSIYQENRRYLEMFKVAGFNLPPELRTAAEYALSRRLEREIAGQHMSLDPSVYAGALETVREAERLGYHLDKGLASQLFSRMVTEAVRGAMNDPDPLRLAHAMELVSLAGNMGLALNLDRAQEEAVRAPGSLHTPASLNELARLLHLDPALLLLGGEAS